MQKHCELILPVMIMNTHIWAKKYWLKIPSLEENESFPEIFLTPYLSIKNIKFGL